MDLFRAASQKVIANCLAESSRKQYEAPWRTFLSFCEWYELDPYGKEILIIAVMAIIDQYISKHRKK